ncbi:MAG: energy transducer TonB [Gemmatimonadota bacterium]
MNRLTAVSVHPAHERFKRRASLVSRAAVLAAVGVHFVFFSLFPRLNAAPASVAARAIEAVDLPPQVEVPPPPQEIARPATPKIAAVEVSEELTIAATTFDENPVRNLGPPPSPAADGGAKPKFIPYDVAPRLQNRDEVLALLRREYPAVLRDAGVGGTVLLWIFVDEIGKVADARVATSSGYLHLDEAAQSVARAMIFSPAMNRDKVTPVWLSQPVDFSVVN